MMVSKIVVAALVIIVACPILLGYAMNLSEINETGYKPEGDSVNVTPLLRTSVDYNFAKADAFQLNTDVRYMGEKTLPVYEKASHSKTSFPLTAQRINWIPTGYQTFSGLTIYGIMPTYDHTTASINVSIMSTSNTTIFTISNFETLHYVASENTVYFTYYNSGMIIPNHITRNDLGGLSFSYTGSITTVSTVYYYQNVTGNNYFIDLAAGFRIEDPNYSDDAVKQIWLPAETYKTILTVDLGSITASTYSFGANSTIFYKTTVGGVVSWRAESNFSDPIDLYYDQSGDNVYQIYTTKDISTGDMHVEIRYVGGWPASIGEANYFQKYSYDYAGSTSPYQNISFHHMNFPITPILRMDMAEFKAFEQSVIENKNYTPASFKENPQTKITDIKVYGTSLNFGGINYPVSDGNITLDGHNIPVKDIVLSSVPNNNGGYDNKIGNTIISSTANPSSITFNGKWAASVTTQSMQSYSVTKTSWTPGEFGWDGIDQNFLMIGLLAALGAFIGLGIAVRRAKASILPLILVCGGAAAVFFIML